MRPAPRTSAESPNALGVIAAVLAIVGVLGPWATASNLLIGDLAMDTNAKTRVIIIGGAAIVGLLSFAGMDGLEVPLLAGIVGLGIRVIPAWLEVRDAAEEYPRLNVGPGWGLWVCGAAGVVAVLALLVQLSKR